MIQVTPQMRVLVAIESADFRRGIDGLAGDAQSRALLAHQLTVLLSGGDFEKVKGAAEWRRVQQA
jgi:hypothetical protein